MIRTPREYACDAQRRLHLFFRLNIRKDPRMDAGGVRVSLNIFSGARLPRGVWQTGQMRSPFSSSRPQRKHFGLRRAEPQNGQKFISASSSLPPQFLQ